MNFETLYNIYKEGKIGVIIYHNDNFNDITIVSENAYIESLGVTNSLKEIKAEFNLQFYVMSDNAKKIYHHIENQYCFIVENYVIDFELLEYTINEDSINISTIESPERRIIGFYYNLHCLTIMKEEIKEQIITNRFSIMEIE